MINLGRVGLSTPNSVAQVSAVALTAGASADLAYNGGVAVVTATKGGLMYEASVGGQKFDYEVIEH